MSTILSLAPPNVWQHFYSLTQVPRPSGYLPKVQEFLLNFGKSLGVESFQDEAGNIIYRKPATPGLENRKKVILQAHICLLYTSHQVIFFFFILFCLYGASFLFDRCV